jgi:hypothetical protein
MSNLYHATGKTPSVDAGSVPMRVAMAVLTRNEFPGTLGFGRRRRGPELSGRIASTRKHEVFGRNAVLSPHSSKICVIRENPWPILLEPLSMSLTSRLGPAFLLDLL